MNRRLLALLILGLLLAVSGWLFDRALEVQWLGRLLAPDYVEGTELLDHLEANDKLAVLSHHPGFWAVLQRWPGLQNKQGVHFISRSVAFMQFGASVTSDIELIARDGEQREIPARWRVAGARKQLLAEAKARVFWLGTVVFVLGIVVSAVSGIVQFLQTNRHKVQ